MIISLAAAVGADLVSAVLSGTFSSLLDVPLIEKAIASTDDEYADLELAPSLEAMATSEWFWESLKRIQESRRPGLCDEDIDRFCEVFHAGEDTRAQATSVLEAFARNLEAALLQSDRGHETQMSIVRTEIAQARSAIIGEIRNGRATAPPGPLDTPVQSEKRATASGAQSGGVHAILDEGRRRAEAGDVAGALALTHAAEDVGPLDDEAFFRVHNNLASYHLQLDQPEDARMHCEKALERRPRDIRALANMSACYLVLGDPHAGLEYARRAVELDPDNPAALSALVSALRETGASSEVNSLVSDKPWIAQVPPCALPLALDAIDRDDFETASTLVATAIASLRTHRQGLYLRGVLGVRRAQTVSGRGVRPNPLDDLEQRELEQAADALTKLVNGLTPGDNVPLLRAALLIRSKALELLGREDESLRDAARIPPDDPGHDDAARQMARMYAFRGDLKSATESIGRLKSPTDEDALQRAALLFELGNPDTASSIAEGIWTGESPTDTQLRAAAIILKCSSQTAQSVGATLRRWAETDATAAATLAGHEIDQGHIDEALTLFLGARDHARRGTAEMICALIADSLAKEKRWAEAWQLYGWLCKTPGEDDLSQRLAIAQFNAGEYGKALDLTRSVRAGRAAIPVFSDIEARILALQGNRIEAAQLLSELSSVEPDNPDHPIRAAGLAYGGGDTDLGDTCLARVNADRLSSDAEALLELARLEAYRGLPSALEHAYRALRLRPDSEEIHLAYVSVFLSRTSDRDAALDESCVTAGTTVTLKSEAETRSFALLRDGERPRTPDEVAPGDDLAVRLMGLKVGDAVQLGRDAEVFSVTAVVSSYVKAFQDTLVQFSTRFPNQKALRQLHIEGDDITPLLEILDNQHEAVSRVIDLYAAGKLTAGSAASAMGRPLADLWQGILSTKGANRPRVNMPLTLVQQMQLIGEAPPLVFDVTALMTLSAFELADKIPTLGAVLVVPRAVVDDVEETIARRHSRPGSHAAIGKDVSGYFFREFSPDEVQQDEATLRGLLSLLNDSFEVRPLDALLTLSDARLTALTDAVGQAQIAAVLTTTDCGGVLVTDDPTLARLAAMEFGVRSLNTQCVALALTRSGALTLRDYRAVIGALAESSYGAVAVSAEDVLAALERNEFEPDTQSSALLQMLSGRYCTTDSAVRVGVGTAASVWLHEGLSPATKRELTRAVFETLLDERNEEEVRRLLARAIAFAPGIGPIARMECVTIALGVGHA